MTNSHHAVLTRWTLIALALAALAPIALFGARPAEAQSTQNGPIAATALKYVGTHGGQCWTFMASVVREATGHVVGGGGYRQAYFLAGATEVSASQARNGDIIQIASDAGGSSWGSYPGLHTAIILENLGGGRFNAVDSNQKWDEMVRLRPNYDPYAAAARYGLQVHIYRFPGGGPGESGSAPAIPAVDAAWAAGASAVVEPGSCLNLRSAPTLSASKITCLTQGTAVSVTGAPVTADGYTWVPVTTSAGSGWVAANYLNQTAAPAAPAAVAPPAASPSTSDSIIGTTAHTDDSPGCLRVRSAAGVSSQILDCLAAGTAVTFVSDETIEQDGYTWMKVSIAGRGEGWVAAKYLVR